MQQIKKNIGFKGDTINNGLSNNSNSYYCNAVINSIQQLAFKMVYRNCLNRYHLKSNWVSCSEIIPSLPKRKETHSIQPTGHIQAQCYDNKHKPYSNFVFPSYLPQLE